MYKVTISLDTSRGHDVLRLLVRVKHSTLDVHDWRQEIHLNGPPYQRSHMDMQVRLAMEAILRELCHEPTAILGDRGRMAYLPAEREMLGCLASEEYRAILNRYPE